MRYNSPSEMPEFQQAFRDEWLARTLSFHPLKENVCGFVLVPMTLAHYSMLRIAGSALLTKDETPTEDCVEQFLWCLSRGSSLRPITRWFKFRCRKFRGEKNLINLAMVVRGLREYMRVTMIDRPASTVSDGIQEPDYYCDEAAIVSALAREYGWSESLIVNLPLRRVFQYLKEIRHHHAVINGQPHMLCNASEKIADEYMRKVNMGEIE